MKECAYLNELKSTAKNDLSYNNHTVKDNIINKLSAFIKKKYGVKSNYYSELGDINFLCWNYCDEKMQKEHWLNAKKNLINLITLIIEDISINEVGIENSEAKFNINQVFIIHGHDGELKQEVARFIEKLQLKAVILHEQVDNGETIIEKFENYSNVGFAIALISPDDEVIGNCEKKIYRARQNVIFEMGYFMGKIGRDRVFTLIKGDNIELLSDFSGVIYYKYDNELWRLKLIRALKNLGYDIDANSIV